MLRGIFNWLYQSVPGSAGGRKELQRTTKKQEESLNSAEVVCRPHNYDNEEVSLVKEAQARPSEMLDDIPMPKPRLLREKA